MALTVVPLFCARFIKAPRITARPRRTRVTVDHPRSRRSFGERFNIWFNNRFESFLRFYDRIVGGHSALAGADARGIRRRVSSSACIVFPLLGLSFFPRTDAGQFVINLKAPTGTRLAVTDTKSQSGET